MLKIAVEVCVWGGGGVRALLKRRGEGVQGGAPPPLPVEMKIEATPWEGGGC